MSVSAEEEEEEEEEDATFKRTLPPLKRHLAPYGHGAMVSAIWGRATPLCSQSSLMWYATANPRYKVIPV